MHYAFKPKICALFSVHVKLVHVLARHIICNCFIRLSCIRSAHIDERSKIGVFVIGVLVL